MDQAPSQGRHALDRQRQPPDRKYPKYPKREVKYPTRLGEIPEKDWVVRSLDPPPMGGRA